MVIAIIYFAHDLPSIQGLDDLEKRPAIIIVTQQGDRIASYGDVYGDYIRYDDLPQHLIDAVLATEDRRFFYHIGIDPIGIFRAMMVNIQAGKFVQGGSTITQQVAKNLFLSPERTIRRKIQEILLAFWLEANYSKENILAIYVNRMYLGAGNYGIDAAAKRYFSTSGDQVSVMESAILAGLLKAPSRYSPVANPDLAYKRATQVLLNMVDAGYLDEAQMDKAIASYNAPELAEDDLPRNNYRYFSDWIIDELPEYIGNVDADVTVTVTLDPKLQTYADKAVYDALNSYQEERDVEQGALLAMRPDGAVVAMVGGKNYSESQFNRATQATRQPGSIFKLFVYLAALDAGLTPDTKVTDEPVEVDVNGKLWRPGNFGKDFDGEMTIAEGLMRSVNTVAVKVSLAVGIENVVAMARRLGLPDVLPAPSIALGTDETTLLQMTTAFSHLASNGRSVTPYGITKIIAKDGSVLYERASSGRPLALSTHIVRQMNDMLVNVVTSGTGRRAYLGGRPVAGKTGTSQDFRDAWFVGYVPQMVTGVWVGNDDNHAMKGVTGGSVPAAIWQAYMSKALAETPVVALPRSNGEVESLPWEHSMSRPESVEEFSQQTQGTSFNILRKDFWDSLFEPSTPSQNEATNPNSGESGETFYPSERNEQRRIRR